MKTERMVLLVTPAEKARINAEAGKLGISASEYVRKAAAALDADDLRMLPELEALAPAFEETVNNIERNLSNMLRTLEEGEKRREYYRSEEYRAQVREELLRDPDIDWDKLRALFGGDLKAEAAE